MHKLILNFLIVFLIIPVSPVFSKDKIVLKETYDLNQVAFIQGIEIFNDELVVASGLYDYSFIGKINLTEGSIETILTLDKKYFAEGLTFTDKYLWQLTWLEEVAFKFDPITYEEIDQVVYDGEGWGLAYDEDRDVLWMSNGSNILYQRDPETFEVVNSFEINYENMPFERLNELEYVDGYLYCNQWLSNSIVAINLETMLIDYHYDFTEIINQEFTESQKVAIDTLNGIAHIDGKNFYITGKNYPKVFEVELVQE